MVRLKLAIARHLPVLVYNGGGSGGGLSSLSLDTGTGGGSSLAIGRQLSATQPINSSAGCGDATGTGGGKPLTQVKTAAPAGRDTGMIASVYFDNSDLVGSWGFGATI